MAELDYDLNPRDNGESFLIFHRNKVVQQKRLPNVKWDKFGNLVAKDCAGNASKMKGSVRTTEVALAPADPNMPCPSEWFTRRNSSHCYPPGDARGRPSRRMGRRGENGENIFRD